MDSLGVQAVVTDDAVTRAREAVLAKATELIPLPHRGIMRPQLRGHMAALDRFEAAVRDTVLCEQPCYRDDKEPCRGILGEPFNGFIDEPLCPPCAARERACLAQLPLKGTHE